MLCGFLGTLSSQFSCSLFFAIWSFLFVSLRRDAVDVCNRVADKMKLHTKVSYVTLLMLGISIGSLTVVYLNEPTLISESTLNYLTAILALLSGLVTGIISTVNPSQKWTRLRGISFYKMIYFQLFITALHFCSQALLLLSKAKRGSFALALAYTSRMQATRTARTRTILKTF